MRRCSCWTSRRPRSIPDGLSAFYNLVEAREREGRTTFFSSHQLGDAERLASRFAILVNGRLAAVLTAAELADRLASRGTLRLRLACWPEGLLDAVRALVPCAARAGDELAVPGPASMRPRVIEAVQTRGAVIQALTTEESRLDAFYRALVGGGPELP